MSQLVFTPLDTLFFRDGRPYNRDESNAQVVSQFPPFAPTLVGATRAAFARALGWPSKDWDTVVKPYLGGGAELGPAEFSGPYLRLDEQPLFPMPHCLVQDENRQFLRLAPGEAHKCDLGNLVQLPIPTRPAKKTRPLAGWLTAEEFTRVLRGKLPHKVYADEDLFEFERRIGNRRYLNTRNVREDNALYSPSHVRLGRGVELLLQVQGLPGGLTPDNPAPLAGESRLCWITRDEAKFPLPEKPHKLHLGDGHLRYAVETLTPIDTDGIGLPEPNEPYAGLPGKLVSACMGHAHKVGGWDGSGPQRIGGGKPLALRNLLPAGSTFFFEADAGFLDAVLALHGSKIGARTAWGFGQIVIGNWGD